MEKFNCEQASIALRQQVADYLNANYVSAMVCMDEWSWRGVEVGSPKRKVCIEVNQKRGSIPYATIGNYGNKTIHKRGADGWNIEKLSKRVLEVLSQENREQAVRLAKEQERKVVWAALDSLKNELNPSHGFEITGGPERFTIMVGELSANQIRDIYRLLFPDYIPKNRQVE